ncbi:unnamed protein product [Ranitomeya imitator]|uniref:Uncharacterized protein n=1 Tax=Ranitomeya imitator TaxID=111125 RepID=A0ABN9MMD0_9NEOB|nr:unnamed protein product [Ranitomeya imitator]
MTSSSGLHAAVPAQAYLVYPVEGRAKYCIVQAPGKVREAQHLHTAVHCSALNRADKVRLRWNRSVKTRRGRHGMKMGGAGPGPTAGTPLDNVLRQLERCGIFNDVIKTELCFLTTHDAVLHIQKQKKSLCNRSVLDTTSLMQESSQLVEMKNLEELTPSQYLQNQQEERKKEKYRQMTDEQVEVEGRSGRGRANRGVSLVPDPRWPRHLGPAGREVAYQVPAQSRRLVSLQCCAIYQINDL